MPPPVLPVLRQVVETLARDRVVRLETFPRDIAVEDAAELLSLSVQEVEKLIDEGNLPAVIVRNRRCVPFEALMMYKTK
jgi:excisionase family DNA binding protein